MSLLQKIRGARGEFVYRDDMITGECVLCPGQLALSWYEWGQHLLAHTREDSYFCSLCDWPINQYDPSEHAHVPSEIGGSYHGHICKLCDYIQINHDSVHKHLNEEHPEAMFETDVASVVLVPDIAPKFKIIQTGFEYIPSSERYRCGVGKCTFHAKNSAEYMDHFGIAHSTMRTYFCPSKKCTKIIDRIGRSTVPIDEIMEHIELHSGHIFQCFRCTVNLTSKDAIQTHLTADHADSPVKFWHNQRGADVIEKSELIEIVMDCRICDKRVGSKSSAIEHFRAQHSGCQFNFSAVKLIKDTAADSLRATSFIDDSECYREVFGCGACDENFADKSKWLDHYWSQMDGIHWKQYHSTRTTIGAFLVCIL